jgi:ABC-type branched-subunit amino acid transport system substrate-binding protein
MSGSKRLWAISLLLVLALVAMAGCGGDEEDSSSDTTAAGGTATTAGEGTGASSEPVTLQIGGTFALTGAYAEDCAAVLAGFEDYTKWVNENKIVAPWYTDKTIPDNITFEFVWGDDALAPDKALTIYDDLKSNGLLVERVSGSPQGLALKDKLMTDKVGATSQSSSAAYLNPPGNIFTNAPIYTDQLASIADWFMENWTDSSRKPRVAYLTADSALGRSIDIPEMKAYLEEAGYEFVGAQFVPMVPTAPPTTQLAWLKDNNVDLALGVMINPGSQPTIKEAVRLGMGPDLDYKITFGFGYPAHLQVFVPAMGEQGDGVVVAGDFAAMDAPIDGIAFANEMQEKYRPSDKVSHVMYLCGIVEAMTQVEALRLASEQVDPAQLTSADVLEKGFQQIKDFSTGDILITNLTYGPDDPEGVDEVRLQQAQGGKVVELGSYPLRGIIPAN